MNFSEKLKKIREDRNISQKELAEMTDLTQSAISQFETGTSNPNKRTLKILANALNVTYDELLDRKEVNQNAESQVE